MLSILLLILIIVFLAIVGSFLPIGNENSTVRRLPWVTFSIMAVNVIVFYVTLPVVGSQLDELEKLGIRIEQFVVKHPELLADENIREKLSEIGMMSKGDGDAVAEQLKSSPELDAQYREWLRGIEAETYREELNQKITAFRVAAQDSIWHRYGFAPNGKWKAHQLITAAFLHAGAFIFLNLVFFFAMRSASRICGDARFLAFYLLGAAASCIPSLLSRRVPSIGRQARSRRPLEHFC
jgi:membrane associated rhomboid family serine protease